MQLMSKQYRLCSMAMIVTGFAFAVMCPKAVLLGEDGWIWDYPARHVSFEHMLMAIYVTLGLFLIWGARDPVRFLPLIDFAIISGILHASVMTVDAIRLPGMESHFHIGADIPGTYVMSIVLLIVRARDFYLDRLFVRHWPRKTAAVGQDSEPTRLPR